MKKYIITLLLAIITSVASVAQSGTNSPYSQYGLGVLSDQSQGFNRGMNGLAIGLRQSNQVNMLNPASYSCVDSLTMIFDVGLSGQVTNFKEGNRKINANNSDFEYAVAVFRLMPKVGVSFGIVPFSNIGYNYSSTTPVGTSTTTSTESHSGSGGIHQVYVGLGWNLFKGLSVGVNGSYLWGSYDRELTISSNDAYVNTVTKTYSASIQSWKVDFGMQYSQPIGKKNAITLGATYSLGHNLNADPMVTTTNTNSQTGVSTSHEQIISNGLSLPHSFGGGLAWEHNKRLLIGIDYSLQKWGDLKFPELNQQTGQYVLKRAILSDRHKMTIGGEWTPNWQSRKFYNRIRYRLGASYNTPYIKVNGIDGPKEISVSAGFGIPITNSWNTGSFLNISGQWVKSSAKDLITENTFRINIGLTFNERWFNKWKVN
ncbi:MAG: hypothetical protein ACI4B3_07995 [Prevotella sp.]